MHNRIFRLSTALCAMFALVALHLGVTGVQASGSVRDLDMKLLKAAEKGRARAIKRVLDQGADVNCTDDKFGGTPLHWAAYKGHLKAAKILLDRGANIQAKNKDGRTPLILATATNRVPIVKLLLKKGADAGIKGNDGKSASDWADRKNLARIAALLNPPPEKTDKDTPVSQASNDMKSPDTEPRKPETSDASLSAKELDQTPVHTSDMREEKTERKVGEETKPVPESKPSPEPALSETPQVPVDKGKALLEAAEKGDLKQVTDLVSAGADVRGTDKAGATPLILAAAAGHKDVVGFLLQHGANPDVKTTAGMLTQPTLPAGTPALVFAVLNGNKEIVQFLLNAGADINAKNEAGVNALICAVELNRPEIVKFLLQKGADLNIKSGTGLTPLDLAEKAGFSEIKEILVKSGAVPATAPAKEEAKTASQEPPAPPASTEVSKLDAKTNALLEAAAKGNVPDLIRLLGQDGDVNTRNSEGVTLLMLAADSGKLGAVAMLIGKGADLDAKDKAGKTALMRAEEKQQNAVAKFLKERGKTPEKQAPEASKQKLPSDVPPGKQRMGVKAPASN